MLRKLRRLSQFLLRLALVCLALSVVVFLVSTPSQLTPRQKGDTLISLISTLILCMYGSSLQDRTSSHTTYC